MRSATPIPPATPASTTNRVITAKDDYDKDEIRSRTIGADDALSFGGASSTTDVDIDVVTATGDLGSCSTGTATTEPPLYRWFPSYRCMTAAMLCLCFASVHMMNSNMGMAMVCMVESTPTVAAAVASTLPPSPSSIESVTVFGTTTTKRQGKKGRRKHRNGTTHYSNTSTVTILMETNNSTTNHRRHRVRTTTPTVGIPQTETTTAAVADATLVGNWSSSTAAAAPRLRWSAEDQGWIFGAFNAGLLCMLLTGFMADKFNAKYIIIVSVLLASAANLMIPLTAEYDVKYVMVARFLIGLAEALLQPAINSLVTRWFPGSERSYALGLATGGRQIGTLLIVPTAGALCSQSAFLGGWPSIFYVSAWTGFLFVGAYILLGADKPSKQSCISTAELSFITVANTCDQDGQKRMQRAVPWRRILGSPAVWAALISVVCHEFPLMTLIMFLPSYLHDVYHYEATKNGILSALPTACLWISKIGSSYLNTWLQEKTAWETTTISKVLNGIGSAGMALFLYGTTVLDASHAWLAVVFLCCSMLFTGMHTPGCQAALVAVAPVFSGAITGLTFFFVAISGMINPAMTKWIIVNGTQTEWNVVFYISTIISLIPVAVFSACGSADVQWWACGGGQNVAANPTAGVSATSTSKRMSATGSCPTLSTIISGGTAVDAVLDGVAPPLTANRSTASTMDVTALRHRRESTEAADEECGREVERK